MKEMINWRQLYNESQAIQPEDTNVSTERICRLVNIYKNDMIEQDLHRYAQRLSRFSRCCQTCTIKSYTMNKWVDTYISGDKNLFDFRLSGRSVSGLVYYWKKNLLKQSDKRGQLSDFKQNNDEAFSISNLSNIDDNILIKNYSLIPNFISQWIIRFQMYYTYRKAQSFSLSTEVHIQPMKTFRILFQTNISPIFVCFINEDNNLHQLFWIFRHLITIFNWPLTTKIFSNRSFQTNSIFERIMMNSLGFIDLSLLNLNQTDLFSYIYRCLKTCHENGPIIFLFDYSTIFKPKSCDYYLMSFLCDLVRFDLSIPDLLIIPTCLHKSYLSFSQPFLFKELVEFFTKKYNLQKQFCELIQIDEQKIVYKLIDCLFLHLGYDVNQLISTRIEFQHIIAAIELCQMNTIETIFDTLQILLKTCSFIIMDNHKWNEITQQDIQEYYFKFEKIDSKLKLISVIRNEYFLDIISALSILSKIEHKENSSHILESELFNQIKYFLFIFDNKQYLSIRPCQNLHQIIIQHYQLRNYISIDYIPQKTMTFRDIILSDHEWSEDEDEMNEEFIDHDDEEIIIHDISNTIKPFYRINYQENILQLKFFAKLFGSYIEAIIYILKYHIENQLKYFTLDGLDIHQKFYFSETSYFISNDNLLSIIRRAYAYRLFEHLNIFDQIPIFFQVIDENIYPLLMDNLLLLHDEFVKLLNSLI